MLRTNPTEVLTEARARGLPWRFIVEALRNLTEAGSLDPEGRPWIEVAAYLTGYSTNQLRHAQKTYAVIENFILEKDLPIHGLQWPMSNLEVISRIAKASPSKAERLLISSTLVSLRELSKIYSNLKSDPASQISAMSAGHQSARSANRDLYDTLSNGQLLNGLLAHNEIDAIQALRPWPSRHSFAHPDFVVAYHKAGTLRIAAFEGLRSIGDINLVAATKAAVKAAVEASFFDRYYLCLPESTSIEHLRSVLMQLGLHNVGAICTKYSSIKVLMAPTGDPAPDRQPLILQDVGLLNRLQFKS